MPQKSDYLTHVVRHVDISSYNVAPLVGAMRHTAYSARDLATAAEIYDRMLCDTRCGIILCLAGSLVSAGLKKIFADMVRLNMVDAIVSTGANIVDQDFFEALGFHHYTAAKHLTSGVHDEELRELGIDRIYDTLIDEDQLRICDDTIRQIADSLEPRPYSSREFIHRMGVYLDQREEKPVDSIVYEAFRARLPIFCPAMSDCSAGFGLVAHRAARGNEPKVSLDSAKDFHELTDLKIGLPETGLLMIGGGVPKNFAQDIVVAAELLGHDVPMHKYAVQITVADVRDGGLSGSTLREATSWGKVDTLHEQMVYAEATLAVPLVVGYAYHTGHWQRRGPRELNRLLDGNAPE